MEDHATVPKTYIHVLSASLTHHIYKLYMPCFSDIRIVLTLHSDFHSAAGMHTREPQRHAQTVVLDWAQQFLYHVLVAYSVFFILGIKSIRSLGCLLYSLYS